MKESKSKYYLEDYIAQVQSEGKLYFTLEDLKRKFDANYETAIKFSLNKIFRKGKIVSAYKGFYIIVPPEYRSRKVIPPELFIDQLFAYLEREYYVGLLSAATMHGASHQQVMEYFVIIDKPAIRTTKVENLKINYVVKKSIPQKGIDKRKTDAGYINISNPELTAIDLIAYQNRVGGINRVSTVLYELSESISPAGLNEFLNDDVPISVLQRLGYIFDVVLKQKDLAVEIKNFLSDKKIFRIPLKPGYKKVGFEVNEDWKVIQNIKIVTDIG